MKTFVQMTFIASFALASAAYAATGSKSISINTISKASHFPKSIIPHRQVINLNTASFEMLVKLRGIGSKLAKRILAYRKLKGSFKAIEDLVKIHGLSKKLLKFLLKHNLHYKIIV